jgi:hypothetical protein
MMIKKLIICLVLLSPFPSLGQIVISGRILNQADKRPVANASIFLSNIAIDNKTGEDGSFRLSNIKPGKYNLVVSIIGFQKYSQALTIGNESFVMPDIFLSPQQIHTSGLLPVDHGLKQGNNKLNDSIGLSISSRLKDFVEKHPVEKAHLHFDKPYYIAGDTVYFRAYITLGATHQLTKLSGVLHVVFINSVNKIERSIILQIIDGMANGDFALPDSLEQGNYKIRAYTQWMRNEGDDCYFDQTIPILSAHKVTKISTPIPSRPDVQFFPEGGTFVAGVHSKVAFKAIGTDGLGINIIGIVTDNENNNITAFEPAHLGMGYFYITPQVGKIYSAQITFPDGSQQTLSLPKPEVKGISLSIDNDSLPKATVKIEANKAYFNENINKEYNLLIYSGDITNMVTCRLDTPVIVFDILKRRLHTGIATVTLFSPTGEPLCERLLFIQNYDQIGLVINSDKTNYVAREKTIIKLKAKTRADEPSVGYFSVSVIDEAKISVDENMESTILTNLLLTSDLKGSIEQPNYYFNNIYDEKALPRLDLVMLTHGYRGFNWKQILNKSNPLVTYQPEKTLEIDGFVKSLSGKALLNAKVSLVSEKDGSFLTQLTDNEGKFHFTGLIFNDTAKFILQALNANGQNNIQLSFDQDLQPPKAVVGAAKRNSRAFNSTTIVPYQLSRQNGISLKEVIIKDKALKRYDDYKSSALGGPGHADQVISHTELDKIGGVRLSEMLNGKLKRGIHLSSGQAATGQMLMLMDGVEIKNIDDINWHDVENIELFLGANAAIYGMRAGKGVIVITAKQGHSDISKINIPSKGILPINPQGFYKAREFYTPKYTSITSLNGNPDMRATIYWNPDLVTDKDGNASFSYNNADGPGTYRVIIEGIDADGNLGRQVYRYKVN